MRDEAEDILHVDGFAVARHVEDGFVRITASRAGKDATLKIETSGDIAPLRETLEHAAVEFWWALHNLDRRSRGLRRDNRPA